MRQHIDYWRMRLRNDPAWRRRGPATVVFLVAWLVLATGWVATEKFSFAYWATAVLSSVCAGLFLANMYWLHGYWAAVEDHTIRHRAMLRDQ